LDGKSVEDKAGVIRELPAQKPAKPAKSSKPAKSVKGKKAANLAPHQ
jgi:hypothetical protein